MSRNEIGTDGEGIRKALVAELMQLRRGRGLSLAALAQRRGLLVALQDWNRALGRPDSVTAALELLRDSLVELGTGAKARSLRNALAVPEPPSDAAAGTTAMTWPGRDPGYLTARRRQLAETLRLHPDTIENYENEAIDELALKIVEGRAQAYPVSQAPPTPLGITVFVGGTYTDLIDYRRAVADAVAGSMADYGVKVTTVGDRAEEPGQPAAAAVDACAVFIGIFGHTFGVPSPYPTRSVAMAEYDLARAAGKQVLVYLADESLPVPHDIVPADDLRELQADFRDELLRRHPARLFTSPADLAFRVTVDLARVVGQRNAPAQTYAVFDSDLVGVRDLVDTGNPTSRAQVQGFLGFLAESFQPLFTIDRSSYGAHPLLREAGNRLSDLLPEFSLSAQDGVISRTGVRHVILRTETVVQLLRLLLPDRADLLENAAQRIGAGAARDLVEFVLRGGRFVPSSPEAFVALWNYWDRTGGWGTYTLESVTRDSWKIIVRRSFLRAADPAETLVLAAFWRGYIKGFLNESLPQISALMLNLPEQQRATHLTMPASAHVSTVEYETARGDDDSFFVTFDRGPFFAALRALIASSYHRDRQEYADAVIHAREAFHSGRLAGPEEFRRVVVELRLDERYPAAMAALETFMTPVEDVDLAADCFFVANLVVQNLRQQREEKS
ncbi:conserved hypothetical protein [Frankia canadensis]|uniref:DUF4062 domain-containing protein n=2 Tax=Frankia canadensis TaxID=1836972 RepID=A0A2I2KS15_9ACTN|nr:conserved hypothetical protein [Frankia canadensis]SOU55751.1 conserved hypothetical protein [Frankia canadensis]